MVAAAAVQQHMKVPCYEMGKLSAHPVLHENPGACSHPVSNSFCPERTARRRGCQSERESERDTTFKNRHGEALFPFPHYFVIHIEEKLPDTLKVIHALIELRASRPVAVTLRGGGGVH